MDSFFFGYMLLLVAFLLLLFSSSSISRLLTYLFFSLLCVRKTPRGEASVSLFKDNFLGGYSI
ncbi:unnamed protein product [Meloidogyne enterolobii]|uniref:Uncharacterized protein n=1 Tax=Meloidogyne enterolobii TaxID=390850 RepID=A0ACB1AEF9_MELEN